MANRRNSRRMPYAPTAAETATVRRRLCGNALHAKETGNAPIVGAYGIRPALHRMNRIGKPFSLYGKPAQFKAYAIRPYGGGNRDCAAAVMRKRVARQRNWKCANCRGVWHTPCTPPYEPHRQTATAISQKKSRSPEGPQDLVLFPAGN